MDPTNLKSRTRMVESVRAFTLIELLVVVAIIALLIADTTFADFVRLSNNFDQTGPGPASGEALAAAVPEPTTLSLALIGGLVLLRWRRNAG